MPVFQPYDTAVFVRHQIGNKARTAGKMHDLDVVARTVKQVPRIGLAGGEMRREQRKVGVVQTPQKIVERPFVNRCGLFPPHQHRKVSLFSPAAT